MNRFRQENQKTESSEPEQPRSLREFKDSSTEMGPPPRNHRFDLILYWLLPIVIFFAIIAVGVFIALNFYSQDEAIAEVADSTALPAARSIIEVSDLLDAHLNVIGGHEAIEQIRSIRYEGRVVFDAGEYSFRMVLLLPDKGMLVTIPDNGAGVKLMLNGDTAWQVVEQDDGGREIVLLGDEQTQVLKWSFRVHSTFRRIALEGQTAGLSVNEIEYDDKPCYEVKKTMPNGSEFLAVLDKESLYLLKTKELVGSGDGAEYLTVIYDDHRMASGVVEPYITKLYRGEELDNEVRVESVRTNIGFISPIFEVPEGLRK